jgi:predicted CoA-substrate-specific enzyme activase
MARLGIDVGSTTVKGVLLREGKVIWRDYQRHNTKQAERVLAFLRHLEAIDLLSAGRDSIALTGSGAGLIAPLVGARHVQEVVAVAAAVQRLHPQVNFVSEIGGEDMKTIFLVENGGSKGKQVFMQSACSGGTGTFIEKTARKLQIAPDRLRAMNYDGYTLHRISSKCGIFAEADANTLLKGGVPVEEIMASLFEAVVHQNLATLTKGNTPVPQVLLLGGPNLFFRGMQQAWRRHLTQLWAERGVKMPPDLKPDSAIIVPEDALYYAALGCAELEQERADSRSYCGTDRLRWWIEVGQHERKTAEGHRGLAGAPAELAEFRRKYERSGAACPAKSVERGAAVAIGCDFGSTTAKAVALSPTGDLLFSCYALSKGNPIEDAQSLFRQIREAGFDKVGGLSLTGYGKDLLKDILGADLAVVETVAHATAALHYVPDVNVICDVGGCDVKIMVIRRGVVTDFRLNSQCSSGNGAFLQGVAERFDVPLSEYAERAFRADAMPSLAMGCGVFLQSDIVNQQRKGWSADEIMAGLAAVLPLNVWIYAGQLNSMRSIGRKFVLQGGTHKNLAVVKAQVDFITSRVPGAEIVIHPHAGEAGAIGAALALGSRWIESASQFRGFDAVAALTFRASTNEQTTCRWCAVNCRRTFIDVTAPGAPGRSWSKVPLEPGWERVISGNSCSKGLVEDANEMRAIKACMEEAKRVHPNIGEMVRNKAFRCTQGQHAIRSAHRDTSRPQHVVDPSTLAGAIDRPGR